MNNFTDSQGNEMRITKHNDHYLLKNNDGEYHLSIEEFEKLGTDKSIEFAREKITKKKKAIYSHKTIDFKRASDLGFCEYGIKDFCKQLDLDINREYDLDFIHQKITIDVLKQYPNEIIKLFGSETLKYLGGIKGVLNDVTVLLILRPEFIPERTLHILATKFAYQCLHNFEKEYPNDDRPRKAIKAKLSWLNGKISDDELLAASLEAESAAKSASWSASWSAAESAAWSASWSAAESAASSAASSAARSAAWSVVESAAKSAVESAAKSAVESAAKSAARKEQVEIILKELNL